MKKQFKFRYIWIALNFLILALPVFVPSTSIDVIGICVTIMIILSYPLAMLFGWLFFYFDWFDGSIGLMYLMLFAFSVLAYIQWFVLVPRAVQFIKTKFFAKDLKISFRANVESVGSLPEPNADFSTNDFPRRNFYDKQKRTPVERVFEESDD
jgi:hypothetical protein